jgi:hypothetical protein
MATNDTVLEVGALIDLGQFTPGVQTMASETHAATEEMNTDFDRVVSGSKKLGYSMTEARHTVVGLGEEIGVHVPRVISTFIASIGPIGSILAAAFAPIALIGIVQLLGQVGQKLAELSEQEEKTRTDVANFDREMNASAEALDRVKEKAAELAGGPLAGLAAEMALAGDKTLDISKYVEELNKRLADSPGFWRSVGGAIGGAAVDAWHLFDDAADDAERTSKDFNQELANSVKQSRDLGGAIDLMAGRLRSLKDAKAGVNLAAYTVAQDEEFDRQIKITAQALAHLKEMQAKFDQEKANQASEASLKLLSEQEKSVLKQNELESARVALLRRLGLQTEEETRSSLLRLEDERFRIASAGVARQRVLLEQQAKAQPGVDFAQARAGQDAQAAELFQEHEKKRFEISSATDDKITARDNALALQRVTGAKEVAAAVAAAATAEVEREFQAREVTAERETQVLRAQAEKRQRAEQDVLDEQFRQAQARGEVGEKDRQEIDDKRRAHLVASQAELDKIDADGKKNSEARFAENVDRQLALSRESLAEQERLLTAAIAAYVAAYGADGEAYEKLVQKKSELTLRLADAQRAERALELDAALAHQRALLSIERAGIETRQAVGLLSPGRAEAQLEAVSQVEIAAERRTLLAKQALWEKGSAEYARIQKELEALNDQGLRLQAEDENRALHERMARWKTFSGQLAGDFSNAIGQMIQRQRTASEAFRELVGSMVTQFVQGLVRMAVQHALTELLMLTSTAKTQTAQTAAVGAAQTAQTAAIVAAQTAQTAAIVAAGKAQKASGAASEPGDGSAATDEGAGAGPTAAGLGAKPTAISHAYQDAAKAFHWVMGAVPPPISFALAPIVAAGVFSAEMAFASGIIASAAGGFEVPHDQLAFLHKEEKVLPRGISQGFNRIIEQGGAGGATSVTHHHNYNITVPQGPNRAETLRMVHDELVPMIRSASRKGLLPSA